MKTILKGGLVALIGFGLAVTLNAFTEVKPKTDYSYWQYESDDAGDLRDGASYTQISAPTSSPCETGVDLPCVLRLDESIDTEGELDSHLKSTVVFPTDNDIMNVAIYKKP
ncbi:hypothetical protein [Pedobacter frigidisoli]|uniref:hypothetical protein n=1 Tax=Pedobacter frigidisoli TaxID=2530455 RepID=UPI00292F656D|nr:hypothetical protein [Pedobacter frigidisoli]